jgi:hypothetical protein
MSEREHVPTLDEIKANLLEVRNHTHFNIGSPQAIDHLLISMVAIIDAIQVSTPQPNVDEGDGK